MDRVRHRERVVAAHFWNPPQLIPLVEVCRGPTTGPSSSPGCATCSGRSGKQPVVLDREIAGFLGNRLQFALLREALALWAGGVASAEAIDLAVKTAFGRRLAVTGPLESADLGGLDTFHAFSAFLFPELDVSSAPPDRLGDLVRAGHRGLSTGRGIYDWTRRDGQALATARVDELFRHLRPAATDKASGRLHPRRVLVLVPGRRRRSSQSRDRRPRLGGVDRAMVLATQRAPGPWSPVCRSRSEPCSPRARLGSTRSGLVVPDQARWAAEPLARRGVSVRWIEARLGEPPRLPDLRGRLTLFLAGTSWWMPTAVGSLRDATPGPVCDRRWPSRGSLCAAGMRSRGSGPRRPVDARHRPQGRASTGLAVPLETPGRPRDSSGRCSITSRPGVQ